MTATVARSTVSVRTIAWLAGALVWLAGMLLLFLPLSTSVNGNPIRCGSAVVASQHDVASSVLAADKIRIPLGEQIAPIAQAEADCASARHGRADIGWVLFGAGLLVVNGALFIRRR